MNHPTPALHIGGEWRAHGSAGVRPVFNPADGSVLSELPLAGVEEIDAAAASAARGFLQWRSILANDRCRVLLKAASLMRERADAMALAITLEQGKPLAEARREVLLSADTIDFQAEEAKRLYGRTVPPRVPGLLNQTDGRQPIGPVAAFTAWNFPVQLAARKLASALAAGCSVVLKPAEETPSGPAMLVQCFLDAGVPPEAINLVFGHPAEVSARLIAHDAIRKVSLTGSVAVGKLLGEMCAARVKRFTGELGGHAPVIVCADADLDAALKAAVAAKYRNAGQVCASPIRFYVHARLWPQWQERFAAAARALRLGPGLDPQTQMGPLAHARRLEDMERFVDDATAKGARVLCGGHRRPGPGYFFEPTVITEASAECRVQQVEPFGPIAVMQPFDSVHEAITQANALPYGLAAYVFTRDLQTMHRVSDALEAGMVGVNHFGISQPEMPFGGWKESGIGHEMGAEGLLHYTEIKTVLVGTTD